MGSKHTGKTIKPDEIAKFEAIAAEWWDVDGPMAPLHRLNPTRLDFIKQVVCGHYERSEKSCSAFSGLTMLDVGCGAGLVTEPLARLGGRVTGVDAGEDVIAVAKTHALGEGLSIDYHACTIDALAGAFDVVAALEVIEHVADVEVFVAGLTARVKPGGLLIMSTLNRTLKSFLLGIVAAEYVLRWVPAGTHEWGHFKSPGEVGALLRPHGFKTTRVEGLAYNPLRRMFSLSSTDLGMNYLLAAVKD